MLDFSFYLQYNIILLLLYHITIKELQSIIEPQNQTSEMTITASMDSIKLDDGERIDEIIKNIVIKNLGEEMPENFQRTVWRTRVVRLIGSYLLMK